MAHNFSDQILPLKTTIVAMVSFGAGIALLALARSIDGDAAWSWLSFWPLGELGGILVGTGLLGVAWEYFDGKDREARDDARVRRLLKEAAPDFRDAVVRGFAVSPDDLTRVATPQLLDGIATNVLALRLGDEEFAREIYADVRDQAIRTPERWYDVDVSIRLSGIPERSASGTPRFDVVVQCDYTVAPSHPVQRLACTSDRVEYQELMADVPSTHTWFMTPRPGFQARERENFELLRFAVDGEERSIRRSERRTGQTYSATIGEDVVRAGMPVRFSYLLRTVTPQSGHRLFFELAQPTRGFKLSLDYSATDISHMSVTDLVATTQKARISRMPKEVAAKVLELDHDGWLLPRAGFAFVWTLASEERNRAGARLKQHRRSQDQAA
jgi:hypothetical protein